MMKRLTALVHGPAGSGKSWLFASAPGPRLLLDAEGRAEHLPTHPTYWEPRDPLPSVKDDGSPIDTDTTVVVDVRSYADLTNAKAWLDRGGHYFKSVGLDSITEAQDRLVTSVRGSGPADLRDWGEIFDKMADFVLSLKDLRRHTTTPVDVVYVTAGTDERIGLLSPYVRGQLGKKLPYQFDVVGYLTRQVDPTTSTRYRDLLIDAAGVPIQAKSDIDSISQQYPDGHIVNPNLQELLAVINKETPTT